MVSHNGCSGSSLFYGCVSNRNLGRAELIYRSRIEAIGKGNS